MSRFFGFVFAACLLAMGLSSSVQAAEPNWPKTLTLGTASPGGVAAFAAPQRRSAKVVIGCTGDKELRSGGVAWPSMIHSRHATYIPQGAT